MLHLKLAADLNRVERRKMIRQLKKIWAVHHMIYISDSEEDIAAAVNVGVARLQKWKQTEEWQHAIAFWTIDGNTIPFYHWIKDEAERKALRKEWRSLACAEKLWIKIIEEGHDLFPKGLEDFLREQTTLNSEDEPLKNQIGLEALHPEKITEHRRSRLKSMWIHDIITALWCITSIVK